MAETLTLIEQVQSTAVDLALRFGPKLLTAIAIFVVGVMVSRWLARLLTRGLQRIELEPPVRALLARIARVLVLVLFVIMALQNMGVELLPLIAGLGVLGAGVALAMQGLLSDVAAGLSIIFSKPFRVGEHVSILDEEGLVRDISLFNTVLAHPDGSNVVIPNRKIVGEVFHNYGATRQVNLTVGVAYDTDFDVAAAAIADVLRANARVMRDPAPIVQPIQLADSSVQIGVGFWVSVRDYGTMRGEIIRAIVETFRTRGVVIPFPQHQVHLMRDTLMQDVMEESRELARSA